MDNNLFNQIHFKEINKKAVAVFIATPLLLSLIYYFGNYEFFKKFFHSAVSAQVISKTDRLVYNFLPGNLGSLLYWCTVLFVCYVIVPLVIIRFVLRERVFNFGLKLKGAFKLYKIYFGVIIIMLPIVFFFSHAESFQEKYPFFYHSNKITLLKWLLVWECLYILQFFAVEFFFRGFMVFGLEKNFGIYSIFISTIPYCMIHFGKPFPETIGAVIAGIVLGYLSLKSRSVIPGFILHCTVGVGMDLAALWQKGLI